MKVGARFHSRTLLPAAWRMAARCLGILGVLVAFSGSAQALIQPKWSGLTAPQQQALKPLAGEWDKLEDNRRRKWIAVADRYPYMNPEEQKRLQARMADWARLTPDQRREARETYKRSKTLPPEQKKAEWQQYQALPEMQKQQLAAAADQKKAAKRKSQQRLQEGTAVNPVATQKARMRNRSPAPAPAPDAPVAVPAVLATPAPN
jgi:hypothetical protein